MEDRKKQLIIGISAIFILIIGMGMVSYAAFSYSRVGEKLNTITSGVIQMSYTESSNVMTITNALPTTDETGKKRLNNGEYFDFSVTTTIQGNATIDWEIAAEDIADSTFSGSNVKYYLTQIHQNIETEMMSPKTYLEDSTANTDTGRPASMMSLLTGSSDISQTTNYRLRLWVDENYNPQGDGGGLIYKTRINVYGKVANHSSSVMKAYMEDSSEDYHASKYKRNITSITTKTDTLVPNNAIINWDVSEAGDKNVIAYLEDDGQGAGTYKLTLGGKGKIVANSDSSYLFSGFTAVTSINLKNLDTSNVTKMSSMFSGCYYLTALDISSFNTSKVEDMSNMFYDCEVLVNLDVSKFDTANVTTMQSMFDSCYALVNLDVSKFNTSKVINMSTMFANCESLTMINLQSFNTAHVKDMSAIFLGCSSLLTLNVSSFDTSNVTDMANMFGDCSSIKSLDLSNFNTSNVVDMVYMFTNCSSLTSLNVSNFNTSNVTDMSFMFNGCSSLPQLDVSHFNTSKLTKITKMFQNCPKLTSIELGSSWTNIPGVAFTNWSSSQIITVKGSCASKTYSSGWSGNASIVWADEAAGCRF